MSTGVGLSERCPTLYSVLRKTSIRDVFKHINRTGKCVQHTDEQRRAVRDLVLGKHMKLLIVEDDNLINLAFLHPEI